jgi:hypothetical protein
MKGEEKKNNKYSWRRKKFIITYRQYDCMLGKPMRIN